MASTLVSNNPVVSNRSQSAAAQKKKKQKLQNSRSQSQTEDQNSIAKWKSESQQQAYSSKLLHALRQVRLDNGAAAQSVPRRGKAVRDAADRVLAATAKGKTRWSRAILTKRLSIKFAKANNNKRRREAAVAAVATGNSRWKKPRVSILRLKNKSLPAVARKAKVLGRLVPGCRKQPLPVVLEEAGDYIAALEMQVKAMAALAQLLSGSGSGSGSTSTTSS